jgi:hypothetical protein
MNAIWTIVQPALTTTAVLAVLYAFFRWLGAQWLGAVVKSYFDKAAEDYKIELRAHEQGAKIAEYASIAFSLKEMDAQEKYQRANQLAWELFLWLPDGAYRKLGRALKGHVEELPDAMAEVRRQLLKNRAGNLGRDDIIIHSPGVGKPQ